MCMCVLCERCVCVCVFKCVCVRARRCVFLFMYVYACVCACVGALRACVRSVLARVRACSCVSIVCVCVCLRARIGDLAPNGGGCLQVGGGGNLSGHDQDFVLEKLVWADDHHVLGRGTRAYKLQANYSHECKPICVHAPTHSLTVRYTYTDEDRQIHTMFTFMPLSKREQ